MHLENDERNDWREKIKTKKYFQLACDVREEIKVKKSNTGEVVEMR